MDGMNRGMRTFNVQPLDRAGIRRTSGMSSAGGSAAMEEYGERMYEPTERQREPPHTANSSRTSRWECSSTLAEAARKEN
jgi:hypothetical protein